MSWGSMASPVLKMQAASQGIQPSTPSSRGHWPALVSPPLWSMLAWLMMEGGRMARLWAPGREAWAWCGTQRLWTLLLRATIKTPPDSLVLRPQNAKISRPPKQLPLSTSGNSRPLVCMASPLPLFWVVLWRNLLRCLVTPGSSSGSTSVCPWLWPGEMLPVYWPVCKFDLISPVLFLAAFNVLTTITAYH